MFRVLRRNAPLLLLLALTLVGSGTAASDPRGLPTVVAEGLQTYKKRGPEAALARWLRDSALDGSAEITSYKKSLRHIRNVYGRYEGYRVLHRSKLSDRTDLIYLELHYSTGAAYAKFVTYENGKSSVTVFFEFQADPTALLPRTVRLGE